MTKETHIATAIGAISPDRIQIDENAKEILADVQVLARILKYTVTELQELDIDEIISLIDPDQIVIGKAPVDPGLSNLGKVKGSSTEDIILGEGTVYFDIRFPVYYKGKSIKILLNIEAQKSTSVSNLKYHLENRVIYYLSRMISSQKNVEFFHNDYDGIKKVYSIWICMDSGPNSDSIDEFFFTQKTTYGTPRHFPCLDKMHGVIISIRPNENSQESKNKLISMLEDLLASTSPAVKQQILSEKHGIKMTTTLERSISQMCNISEFFIEQATAKGIEQGMAQGIEQGTKEGIKALVSTLKELDQTNEFICNKIVEKFDLTEEEAVKYL